MRQATRALTSCVDSFLEDKRYLIVDRDTRFCELFRSILRRSYVQRVSLSPKSRNLKSQLEQYFGSLNPVCLGCIIFFRKRSLERAVREDVKHYHIERNHRRFGNMLIDSAEHIGELDGEVECTERLGELLKYYHRTGA